MLTSVKVWLGKQFDMKDLDEANYISHEKKYIDGKYQVIKDFVETQTTPQTETSRNETTQNKGFTFGDNTETSEVENISWDQVVYPGLLDLVRLLIWELLGGSCKISSWVCQHTHRFVNFEARLEDGTVVAKSDGVEFTIREGYLCPALSKAMKTIKMGQKVFLTVKPQYGFGEKGKPATGSDGPVPPNKNIEITLELVSWKNIVEVTDDRKVIKKILKEGEGYERPNVGAIVKYGTMFLKKGYNEGEYRHALVSGIPCFCYFVPFYTDVFSLTEQVIEGLDRAMLITKKGEVALLSIAPEYAFGSSESRQELAVVPANSTVYYDVKLVSFEKEKESWDLNMEEKIVVVGRKKKEGNVLFKVGKYARSSKRYDKFIEYDTSFSEEEKNQAKALKVACNLHNATCKLKLEDYKQLKNCVLRLAYIQLADLDLVEFDIKKALEIDPENKDVKLEYKKLKEKLKEYNKKEAKFYGNMFAKMSKLDTHESNEAEPMNVDTKA
ncbi:hypothetical protein UlMin_006556 [Ulmus minor]